MTIPDHNLRKLYEGPMLTVDVVIFTVEEGALKVLLIERANDPFKEFAALPGGFIRWGETAESTALRILMEKAGVSDVFIEQLFTFDDPGRDPRGAVASITYVALVPPRRSRLIVDSSSQIQHPHFVSVLRLPKLAFDHKAIIAYALKRLRAKLEYTNAAYSLLPKEFTLSDLQETYEAVLGKRLDKRNFRKKFLELGLIAPRNKKTIGGRQRPAELYAFTSRRPTELRKFF